jgi:hypothetical protein
MGYMGSDAGRPMYSLELNAKWLEVFCIILTSVIEVGLPIVVVDVILGVLHLLSRFSLTRAVALPGSVFLPVRPFGERKANRCIDTECMVARIHAGGLQFVFCVYLCDRFIEVTIPLDVVRTTSNRHLRGDEFTSYIGAISLQATCFIPDTPRYLDPCGGRCRGRAICFTSQCRSTVPVRNE